MTSTVFLLARIAEDERAAEAVMPSGRPLERGRYGSWRESASVQRAVMTSGGEVVAFDVPGKPERVHIARHDPARVLAECEAKRRIVEQARMAVRLSDETPDDGNPKAERIHGAATAWECALDVLALPYADHPDYRDEWS